MKRRFRQAAFVLAALACTASLALPCAVAAWEDARLYGAPVARPAVEGTMSSRGREIPAAYELFRKRLLSGSEFSQEKQTADPTGMAQTLCEKTQALAEAGVLSESVAQQIQSSLPEAKNAFSCSQDGVSEGICQSWTGEPDNAQFGWECSARWLTSSGLVTYFEADWAVQMQPEDVLTAYRSYLGLDALTDWQTLDTSSFSANVAAMWSAEGQIYLFCSAQNGFALGAVSVAEVSLPLF